ncbi:MAG: SpoIID/LytB domain-containing protein [Clostridia bacterium]
MLVQDSAAGTAGIPSADDIARVVQQEMGSSFEPEALKAQAVAAYTYARNHGNSIGGMSSVSDITKVSEKVRNAVQAVYGQMVTYNGQPINAVFHAMSAGKTADSRTIWGGAIPYLTPVDSAGDIRQNRYQVTTTYTAQEMAGILEDALGVTMGGDPAEWFTILSQDGAVSAEIGYVGQMRIQINSDSYTDISGNYFRENVMGYSRMRSPCFTITYTA